jgi:hypothetical protein
VGSDGFTPAVNPNSVTGLSLGHIHGIGKVENKGKIPIQTEIKPLIFFPLDKIDPLGGLHVAFPDLVANDLSRCAGDLPNQIEVVGFDIFPEIEQGLPAFVHGEQRIRTMRTCLPAKSRTGRGEGQNDPYPHDEKQSYMTTSSSHDIIISGFLSI